MTTSAERFSLISQSILNRFTCNFAHTIRSHCGDCPENLVRFDQIFQKLLMWCTETTLFPRRQSAENAGRHWNSTEEVPSPHRTCVTEQLELTRQVAWIERVIINTTSTLAQYRFFFFFFFFKIWYLAENKRERLLFRNTPYWGRCKTPYLHFLMTLTSDSDVKSRQTKNERNAKTVTMATNPLSTMRFHWSLGIFVIIFTRFSLISQSILHRFSCNFAGTTCNYSGDFPEKFVKFERVFPKLLVRLVVNLLEYF